MYDNLLYTGYGKRCSHSRVILRVTEAVRGWITMVSWTRWVEGVWAWVEDVWAWVGVWAWQVNVTPKRSRVARIDSTTSAV